MLEGDGRKQNCHFSIALAPSAAISMKTSCISLSRILHVLLFLAFTSGVCAALFGSGSLNKPVSLPEQDVSKLTGKAHLKPNGDFEVSAYNGSDWNVVEMTIEIVRAGKYRTFNLSKWKLDVQELNPNGSLKKFKRVKSFLPPKSNGEFAAEIGDYLNGAGTNWTWSIEQASGFK